MFKPDKHAMTNRYDSLAVLWLVGAFIAAGVIANVLGIVAKLAGGDAP